MVTESVKALLGEELAAQVETVLAGKGKDGKDVDLVVGNDGSFVPAEKHDGLKAEAESATKALKKAAEALKAVGGSGDPAKIPEDVLAAQNTINTLQEEQAAEIKRIQTDTALRMALAGKAHDPADIIGQLDVTGIELDAGGNLKTDLDDLLKPIREAKPYLFVEEKKEEAPDLKGATPAQPGQPPAAAEGAGGPTIF